MNISFKNILHTLLLWCIALTLGAQAPPAKQANDNAFNSVSYRPLTPLKVNGEQGVSAPFAGSIYQNLIVAGGCNFPDVPAAKVEPNAFMPTSTNCHTPITTRMVNGTKLANYLKPWLMVRV